MNGRRRIAWVLLLVVSGGFAAWGFMAAAFPDYLLGPGGKPNRLIREMHEQLLARGRGSEKQPGEFRRSQNWIGGTRPGNAHFIPPPPSVVDELMSALERIFHEAAAQYPVVVTAGLAHVQFETIHPFLDGNGRIGRLLIPLLLHDAEILQQPLVSEREV